MGANLQQAEEMTADGNSDPQENVKGTGNDRNARKTKTVNITLAFLPSLSFLDVIKAFR